MKDIYLVTGAAGHLGSSIILELLKDKKVVRGLVLSSEKKIPKNIEVFKGDVLDKDSMRDAFICEDSERLTVIHTAGIISTESKFNQLMYDVNVLGTQNIIDLSIEYNIKKLIYISSVHAIVEKANNEVILEVDKFYPEAVVGEYAKTKALASQSVVDSRALGLDACIIFPSGIVGPNDLGNGYLTSVIIDYYNNKLPFGVVGGYDFVDVRDVAYGILS